MSHKYKCCSCFFCSIQAFILGYFYCLCCDCFCYGFLICIDHSCIGTNFSKQWLCNFY